MILSADPSSTPLRLCFGASLDLRPYSSSTATKPLSPSLWSPAAMPQPQSRSFSAPRSTATPQPKAGKTSFNTQ